MRRPDHPSAADVGLAFHGHGYSNIRLKSLHGKLDHSYNHRHTLNTMQDFKERQLVTDPQKAFHFTDLQRLKPTRANDPYDYQAGWGNRHQSEVIPGTLPVAQNNPQEVRFGLYTEGITYSAFAAPRAHNFSTYMYRCRPAAAHSMYCGTFSQTLANM